MAERRSAVRFDAVFPVKTSLDTSNWSNGKTINVGGEGILLVTPNAYDIGSEILVEVQVDGNTVQFAGYIVRQHACDSDQQGYGVKISQITEEQRKLWGDVMLVLLRRKLMEGWSPRSKSAA